MSGTAERVERSIEAIEWLDEAFQSKARLGIFSCLAASGDMEFRRLKQILSLTDGNLAAHLSHLEKRGFVVIDKRFVGRKPLTTVSPSDEGLSAFREHLAALESMLLAVETR